MKFIVVRPVSRSSMPVSVGPGATALTRTPNGAPSLKQFHELKVSLTSLPTQVRLRLALTVMEPLLHSGSVYVAKRDIAYPDADDFLGWRLIARVKSDNRRENS
jgi:hypothetical protein